jgi:HEAT repeat protein
MAMRSAFEETLTGLRDAESPLKASQLFNLSSPSRADMLAFAHYWPEIDVDRRRRIIQFLTQIAEENFEVDFRPIFRHCLDDTEAEVRALAIDGLWEDEDVNLIAPLVHLLEDDLSVRVRASAATALGKYMLMGELDRLVEGHVTFIRQALIGTIRRAGEDLEVRRRAVESISYAGDEEVSGIIEAAYYASEEKMRISGVFAMGRNADPRWRTMVLSELGSLNPEMRFEAARACGELSDRKAVPQLIRLLNDPDSEVQSAAIWALGQVGGRDARRALEKCCESEDEVVRDAAEDALAELEFGQGTEPLLFYEFMPDDGNGHVASEADDFDENEFGAEFEEDGGYLDDFDVNDEDELGEGFDEDDVLVLDDPDDEDDPDEEFEEDEDFFDDDFDGDDDTDYDENEDLLNDELDE